MLPAPGHLIRTVICSAIRALSERSRNLEEWAIAKPESLLNADRHKGLPVKVVPGQYC